MSIQNIVEKETAWVCQREDLIALAQGAEHGWFNAFLEDFLNIISRKALLVSNIVIELPQVLNPYKLFQLPWCWDMSLDYIEAQFNL
jgi:hypothetical protein